MDTSVATAFTEALRNLPADGVERELTLQRLTECCAAAEATSALHAAAVRARQATAPGLKPDADALLVAEVLSAAAVVWDAAQADASPRRLSAAEDAHDARAALALAIASPAFARLLPAWIAELRAIASVRPSTGACTVATALQLWTWTITHAQRTIAAARRDAAVSELADAACALIAARCQILAVANQPASSNETRQFFSDLCHVQAAHAASTVAARCAEIVFGYRTHPTWSEEGCAGCYSTDDLEALEGLMPGIAGLARGISDVIEHDGSHPAKAGPCARFDGVDGFTRLRARLDGCLTGSRLTAARAADALPRVFGAAPVAATTH